MVEVIFGDQVNRVTEVTAASEEQTLDLGLQCNSVTLVLKLIAWESPGSSPVPSLEVQIETSMKLRGGDWLPIGSFDPQGKLNDPALRTFSNLLRYVRWRVITFEGAAAITFTLEGMAR